MIASEATPEKESPAKIKITQLENDISQLRNSLNLFKLSSANGGSGDSEAVLH